MRIILKVLIYITHGDRLLVFTHPEHPAAGLQVPGGTVETGEALVTAAFREAREETGLRDLCLVRRLGMRWFDGRPYGKSECHLRHFFHLTCTTHPPTTWEHVEMASSDLTGPHRFRFHWCDYLAKPPDLIAEMGACLDEVRLPEYTS